MGVKKGARGPHMGDIVGPRDEPRRPLQQCLGLDLELEFRGTRLFGVDPHLPI